MIWWIAVTAGKFPLLNLDKEKTILTAIGNQLPSRKRTGYEKSNAQGEKVIDTSGREFYPQEIKDFLCL
jgi:hypothetical protein